ncbi:hypothetical protein J2754_002175 [Halarchaeum solikamskense]|nr:hypothetical protein [Halarchaeum solikamskense]
MNISGLCVILTRVYTVKMYEHSQVLEGRVLIDNYGVSFLSNQVQVLILTLLNPQWNAFF